MTTESEAVRRLVWRDPIVAVAVAIILAVELLVIWRALPRALDHDEGEHLRAAAWVASGKTLYRDFAENHTPFLYLILAPFAPAAGDAGPTPATNDIAATRHYVMVARALSAIAGIAAVICIAGVAGHLAGDALAALPVLAALLASSWTWLRGVADVRSEPYTLMLFWAGAFLIVRSVAPSRRAIIAAGVGIGLIAVADLWNPKWPLESLVMLGLYTAHLRRRAARAAPAEFTEPSVGASPAVPGNTNGEAAGATRAVSILASLSFAGLLPLVALCVALRLTTLRDLIFFSFTYAAAVSRWYRGAVAATSAGAFAFCPSWLAPWGAVMAAAVFVGVSWLRRRGNILFVLFLIGAASLEVVLLYPYPHLWPQYLVMWACVVALLYGVTIAAVVRQPKVRALVAAIIVIGFAAHEWQRLTQNVDERYWQTMSDLQQRLGPGGAAWVRPEELPTAAPAGSYYWYAFTDQVPFSLAYGQTGAAQGFLPPLRDEDLPPCRILAGIDTMHVRLIDGRAVHNLPASRRCMEELARHGSLRRIDGTPIWEVIR